MKYYLLDYENVSASGLDGVENLTSDCRIVLFYTKNSNKIDLGVFNQLRGMKGDLSIIEVHHGKQALDIQLASYLGYLIGTEPEDTEYYIVSKDKGYFNVQSFWPDRKIVLCRNLYDDSEVIDEPSTKKKSSSRTSNKSDSRNRRKSTAAKSAKTEPKAKQESGAKSADKPEMTKPAAEAETKAESKTAQEPQTNAFAEAAAIAKAVVEAKKARNEADNKKKGSASKSKPSGKQKASEKRNEVNNKIQKILSKEGFDGDCINATASIVSKNIGKDGYKQVIYRSILKENGQKQGLAIYRLIKDIL